MADSKGYKELSYQDNSTHYGLFAAGAEHESRAKSWLDPDTVDAWRHGRMYAALDPLLQVDSSATWLTVGDGRYGKDARYISQRGGDVVATDLDDTLLAEAKDKGYISKFSRENAESLSCADQSFDYLLCKESYHHFPRPMLALYEMLRVASKGVVLIEPNDRFISYSVLRQGATFFIGKILSLLNKEMPRHCFEDFGNYVYAISRRELEKVALGLNYRYLAFKGINDHYLPGVESEKYSQAGPLFKKLKRRIMLRDLLAKLRIVDYDLLAAIVFKQAPSDALLQRLADAGYTLVCLPENPSPHGNL